MSRPSNTTLPPVGSSRRMMQRAIVDFPQPDSPTTPRVRPRARRRSRRRPPSPRRSAREHDPARDREVPSPSTWRASLPVSVVPVSAIWDTAVTTPRPSCPQGASSASRAWCPRRASTAARARRRRAPVAARGTRTGTRPSRTGSAGGSGSRRRTQQRGRLAGNLGEPVVRVVVEARQHSRRPGVGVVAR